MSIDRCQVPQALPIPLHRTLARMALHNPQGPQDAPLGLPCRSLQSPAQSRSGRVQLQGQGLPLRPPCASDVPSCQESRGLPGRNATKGIRQAVAIVSRCCRWRWRRGSLVPVPVAIGRHGGATEQPRCHTTHRAHQRRAGRLRAVVEGTPADCPDYHHRDHASNDVTERWWMIVSWRQLAVPVRLA